MINYSDQKKGMLEMLTTSQATAASHDQLLGVVDAYVTRGRTE